MRLPLWFALYVAIAVALNPVDDDIQPFDSNDLFADLGATEFFPVKDLDPFESLDAIDLVSIPSSGSSSVLASSCLTRNELPSGRLRARDEKSCVIPFEGLPTGFDDISNMIDGSASEETLPEDSLLELPAVDAPKSFNCLPNFPYHVCCDQRGPTSDDFPSMPVLVYKYLLRCDIGVLLSFPHLQSQLS